MNIDLHIDRLVLDGVSLSAAQQQRLRTAFEAELSRRLGEGGLGPAGPVRGERPGVRADDVRPAPGATPAQFGRQIAQAVYQGLTR